MTTPINLYHQPVLDIRCQNQDLLPIRANPTDAGLDLKAAETYVLQKNIRTLVKTGVQVRIPPGFVGLLFPRSSLSKRGIVMTNSVGVIDSDYRGEVMASLMYTDTSFETLGMSTHAIAYGERIVQLVVVPIVLPSVNVVNEINEAWNDTTRGSGGFGSTGAL